MKNISFLSGIITFSVLLVAFTMIPVDSTAQKEVVKKYYLSSDNINFGTFNQDTITIFKENNKLCTARLELYKDQSFCLFYHLKYDKVIVTDLELGLKQTKIKEYADKLQGKFEVLWVQESEDYTRMAILHLTTENKEKLEYVVQDTEKGLVLIRKVTL
ncbi:hypothetical protein [Carboxylicivirga marina]|uniref:Uncharacterized protein n=1 Tax=Carboxylicivirga marina TaxID=2800988 RepID=A0ABS1HIB0_9BACT|nr:hypothetical protein [Carboxylicivirga marina]MBK3517405.1 hypothetical protein [Carboxylicivirga marina]